MKLINGVYFVFLLLILVSVLLMNVVKVLVLMVDSFERKGFSSYVKKENRSYDGLGRRIDLSDLLNMMCMIK